MWVCVCGGGYVCGIFNSARTAAAGDSRCEQAAPQRCKYSLLFFSSFCYHLRNEYFPEFIAAEATCVRACQCARAQPASQNLSSAISLEYVQTPTPSQMVRDDVVGFFGGYFVFLFCFFHLLFFDYHPLKSGECEFLSLRRKKKGKRNVLNLLRSFAEPFASLKMHFSVERHKKRGKFATAAAWWWQWSWKMTIH